MRFGLMGVFGGAPLPDAELLAHIGVEAERLGFESIWASEHAVWFEDAAEHYPYSADGKLHMTPGLLEPLVALTFVAAHTKSVKLATGVLILPQRNPVYAAQQLANIDWLSGGRVLVGVGLGWHRAEYAALQVPWDDRARRFDEYLDVMRSLWSDSVASFSGTFYDLPECQLFPPPIQRPFPPIHVGGNSDRAIERAAKDGQGWYGLGLTPDELAERVRYLHEQLERFGRAPGDVEITLGLPGKAPGTETISAYAEIGVDRLLGRFDYSTKDRTTESLESLAHDLGVRT